MATESDDADKWNEVIQSELTPLKQTGTLEIVDNPKHAKVINCKWIRKTKRTSYGEVDRLKVRLVIFGNQEDVPILHKFSPVVYCTVGCLMLAISSKKKSKIH